MQVTDELRVLVEAEVARAIENFKKLSDGVEDSEKKTASLGEALDSLSKKSLIISGVLGGAGIAAVKFAGENEKLKLSLKNMLGSAEEAASVFEDWRKLGASPGLNTDEVFSLGKAMVNMGKDTQYATSTIEMLGNIAAGTGVSFGEISGSFEHVRAVGNLTTRDLVSLQQKGIPIVKQLAKEMGTSEENIKKLAAEGKIGFSDLERAFKSMTSPGGQFAGMMNELSGTVLEKFSSAADDAKQALAAFGETLLPIAADLLDGASSILHGITDMDEGTKRFVLGMGGIIVISGPATKAIKSISSAMTMLAANPAIIGLAAAAAGVALFVTAFADARSKFDQAAKDYDTSIKKISNSNQELIKNASFDEVSRQIRGLTKDMYDAARETGNFAAATEAAARLLALNQRLTYVTRQADEIAASTMVRVRSLIDILETPVNPDNVVSSWVDEALNGYTSESRKIEDFFETLRSRGYDSVERILQSGNDAWIEAVSSQSSEAMLQVLKNINGRSPQAQSEIDRILQEISELSSGATIRPLGVAIGPPTVTETKKTWQKWFGEIAKVDPELFGDSGAKAAQLYIANFERGLTAQTTIAEALDQQFDITPILRSRQSDVQNALVELLSIDPDQINRPFKQHHEEIDKLIAEYRKLGEEAKSLEDRMSIEDTLKSLQEEYQTLSDEVQGLTKDKYDLALASMRTAGATDIEIEKAEELIKNIKELSDATEKAALSFEEMFSKKVADGLKEIFPNLEKQATEALGNIAAQLAMISFDSILTGLSAVGELFAKGSEGVDDFKQAMADMAQQILNQLPNMFLQAGLQLIAQGQWALGLGFVAAAGTSAVIDGYVRGRQDSATANAHGNAFDANGIIPYAHGGSFTNQIVNTPTYFRHGGKLGVMGEAGPESIMPLRRMANGDLGVAAQGGGANVTVNIINNTSEEVRQEESTDSEGNKQIDVIVGQIINNHISSGKADRAMTRFGSRPVGV